MAFYERSELFGKYPKTPVFDHSNYRLFERIPAVPGTSNNRDLTVDDFVPFCRPQSGTVIIQLMTELKFLITKYRNSNTKTV